MYSEKEEVGWRKGRPIVIMLHYYYYVIIIITVIVILCICKHAPRIVDWSTQNDRRPCYNPPPSRMIFFTIFLFIFITYTISYFCRQIYVGFQELIILLYKFGFRVSVISFEMFIFFLRQFTTTDFELSLRTIIILCGSMWGQIHHIKKITISQEVQFLQQHFILCSIILYDYSVVIKLYENTVTKNRL